MYLTSALLALVAGATAIAAPGLARADEADDVQASAESDSGPLNDRFMLSLGTFMLSTNTKIQVNGSAGQVGTDVDLNRDLGFKDADRFRLDGTWRFFKRHKLRAMYFSTSRSSTGTLQRDITIGDTTYPVDATVTAKNKHDDRRACLRVRLHEKVDLRIGRIGRYPQRQVRLSGSGRL